MVGGRIFLQRLEDERVAVFLEDHDLPQRAGVGEDLRLGLGDGGPAVDQDLAGLRVDDVAAGDPAFELGGRLGVGRVDGIGFVKGLQDVLVARVFRAHRAKEGHRRELARLVDAHSQGVFLGHLQLDPASAFRNDPAGVQLLVVGLDLDDEVDARRAVELADHDAFGAIDDEFAAADHDRHVAEVDRFLEGRLAFVEPQPDVQRAAEGQAELAAFVRVVARFAQVIAQVFELEGLVVALDREDLAKDPFQARVFSFVAQVGLEESLVAPRLDLGQVGHRKLVGDPAEVPLLAGQDAPHGRRDGHGLALQKGRRENRLYPRATWACPHCAPGD